MFTLMLSAVKTHYVMLMLQLQFKKKKNLLLIVYVATIHIMQNLQFGFYLQVTLNVRHFTVLILYVQKQNCTHPF